MRGAHLPAVIQEADGADDVGELVSEWIVEGGPDPGESGKVDYRVEGFLGEQSLADVAHLEPNTVRQRFLRGQLVEKRADMASTIAVVMISRHSSADSSRHSTTTSS